MDKTVRIDKWCWAARFFKTRPLAAAAVSGGKVHLGGQRVKPGRALKVGDRLQIQRAGLVYDIEVLALSDKRGSATMAAQLYAETEASKAAREHMREIQKLASLATPQTEGRPNKKQRRHIIRFKQDT